jgi:hypothetical protein
MDLLVPALYSVFVLCIAGTLIWLLFQAPTWRWRLVTIAGLALWTPAVAFVFVIVDWPVQVRGREVAVRTPTRHSHQVRARPTGRSRVRAVLSGRHLLLVRSTAGPRPQHDSAQPVPIGADRHS